MTPNCPRCETPMVKRNGPNGPFWGCSTFPRCRGTRNIDPKTLAPDTEVQSTATAPPLSTSGTTRPAGGVRSFVGSVEEPPKFAPLVKMPGSDEQEAIWDYQLNGKSHMVVNAGPGTGKTWTEVQYCLRAPKMQDILFVAFNVHIAREANGKLRASKCFNTTARTYHSLGRKILTDAFPALRNAAPDEGKMRKIFESLVPMPLFGKAEWRRKLNLAEKLASFVKSYLIDYEHSPDFFEEMEAIADRHGLDMNGHFAESVSLVGPALDECKKQANVLIDYDDMPWLPVVLDLPVQDPPSMMITDESQDLAPVQHALTLKVGARGRIVIVGDRRQAIYAWRGASADSIEILASQLGKTKLGVKEFPLTITRRCPKLHVQLAQALYPNIQALDDAPLGEIISTTREKATAMMKPGDMVICRINAALIPTAYALIRRNIRPIVKGRDIGQGLKSLIATLEEIMVSHPDLGASDQEDVANSQFRYENGGNAPTVPQDEMRRMHAALEYYEAEQISKLMALGDKAEGRIANLQDKCGCLEEFIANSKTVDEMKLRIDTLFEKKDGEDTSNAVVLGTVHRTKGLEAERVFVLAPELIPHPMAKTDDDKEQEKHIAWIASTRAKFDNKTGAPGTIVFCGHIPPIYSGQPTPPPPTYPDLEKHLDKKELELEDVRAAYNQEDDDEPPF